MRYLLKVLSLFVLILTALSALGYFFWYRPKFDHSIKNIPAFKKAGINTAAMHRLKQKASLFNFYNREGSYDADHCFFIDMRISSGKKRFFVYNPKKDSVEAAGLVTHGSGSTNGSDDLYFSNVPGSNCTSLGRYKVGPSYSGKFGLAYKLYGLDRTNSKAYERFVVLHSHSCVPEGEVDPLPICESWGCPTISPAFLAVLKNYIADAGKPILLWIYY